MSECRRCGLTTRAANAGVLCEPGFPGHDFPKCNCNARGGYLKAHGPDPAHCPIHGEPRVPSTSEGEVGEEKS